MELDRRGKGQQRGSLHTTVYNEEPSDFQTVSPMREHNMVKNLQHLFNNQQVLHEAISALDPTMMATDLE